MQLGLQLLHRVQHHADDDQKSSTADRQCLHVGQRRGEVRHDSDDAQEDRAGRGDTDQDARDVVVASACPDGCRG